MKRYLLIGDFADFISDSDFFAENQSNIEEI